MGSLRLSHKRINHLCESAHNLDQTTGKNLLDLTIDELQKEFSVYRNIVEAKLTTNYDEKLEDEFLLIDTKISHAKQHVLSLIDLITVPSTSSAASLSQTSSINEFLEHQREVLTALTNSRIANHPTVPESQIKLPSISIPKFSGDFKDWLTFHDLFESTINNNNQLSAIQKFQYLRSLVIEDAALLINALPLTALNYPIAWENLRNRYNKPYLIVQSIIKTFFDIDKVSPNCSNLRHVVNVFSETIQVLDAQGNYANSRDPWMIYLMLEKLDRETGKAWAEHSTTFNEPSLEQFSEFLKTRCSALELYHSQSTN